MEPPSSPPFHQISLPESVEPVRKLQTVKFSKYTPLTVVSTPLRPRPTNIIATCWHRLW